jgi:hypothetical protein
MKTIITIVLLIASFSVFSQDIDSTFSKFDLNKYNSLNEINVNHYFLEDSTKITFAETDSIYQIIIFEHNSHYSLRLHYFKTTLTLKSRMQLFQKSNKIGIYTEYNEKGGVLTEHNYDTIFTFTLQDLKKKMASEYKLNIMDVKQGVGVILQTKFEKPSYKVYWPENNNPMGIWRWVFIDGLNGETLNEIRKAYECKAK